MRAIDPPNCLSDRLFPRLTRNALTRVCNSIVYDAIMNSPGTREADNLGNRFANHFESYFTFITTPGVEPTTKRRGLKARLRQLSRRPGAGRSRS